jgi:hypothetical protein
VSISVMRSVRVTTHNSLRTLHKPLRPPTQQRAPQQIPPPIGKELHAHTRAHRRPQRQQKQLPKQGHGLHINLPLHFRPLDRGCNRVPQEFRFVAGEDDDAVDPVGVAQLGTVDEVGLGRGEFGRGWRWWG